MLGLSSSSYFGGSTWHSAIYDVPTGRGRTNYSPSHRLFVFQEVSSPERPSTPLPPSPSSSSVRSASWALSRVESRTPGRAWSVMPDRPQCATIAKVANPFCSRKGLHRRCGRGDPVFQDAPRSWCETTGGRHHAHPTRSTAREAQIWDA
jgi:hypothetical protein